MQISILDGIFTDSNGELRSSYPKNYVPVALSNGISAGYLKPARGIVEFCEGPGTDRGGTVWKKKHYRVMGTKFVEIDSLGNATTIGDVGGDSSDIVKFDNSFDYLGIASNGTLYLYDGSTLITYPDSDIGTVNDFIWINGKFLATDSETVIQSDATNPLSVNPLSYGSSEIDPDPIVALIELRNEAVFLNRNTIEYFRDIGTTGFSFQRIDGAQIEKGCIGKRACCKFLEQIAFVGNGKKNESIGVYLGANGNAVKISTREIEKTLKKYTEDQLSNIILESMTDEDQEQLYIKLPDQTLVYDNMASKKLRQQVWFILHSGLNKIAEYRAQNLTYVYDKWFVGDPTSSKIGYYVDNVSSHYGKRVGWDFSTSFVYNESKGAIIHEMELIANTGFVALGDDPTIYTSWSTDGLNDSEERFIKAGKQGERSKRLSWRFQGKMEDRRIQRFRGNSDSHLTFLRLEAEIEPLYV